MERTGSLQTCRTALLTCQRHQWGVVCRSLPVYGFLELANAKQDTANPPGMLSGFEVPFGTVGFGHLGIFSGDRVMGMIFKYGFLGTSRFCPSGVHEH